MTVATDKARLERLIKKKHGQGLTRAESEELASMKEAIDEASHRNCTCDFTANPPLVHCPECGAVVALTRDTWHTAGCDETDEARNQRLYGGLIWRQERMGLHVAEFRDLQLRITYNRDNKTFSTCGYRDGADRRKAPFIPWKYHLETWEDARRYITETAQAIGEGFI